jgi:predicted ATPase
LGGKQKMLEMLRLKNFKGFEDHRIEFRNFTVVTGQNNAGKSSAFEAIRIIANAAARLHSSKFSVRPHWMEGSGTGIVLAVEDQQRRPETIFYRYNKPPAILEATFSGDRKIEAFIGPGGTVYAEATRSDLKMVTSRPLAADFRDININILPQIRPLEDYESVLRADYVRKCVDTHLSSRHFRNQIRYLPEHFEDFRSLLEQTWKGIRVSEFLSLDAKYEDDLSLMLMDHGFVAEAANFGHGLQMWLQIVWFLSRTPATSVVVFDEPDVYMHPDQQSNLILLLRDRFHQCLLSTHSERIINACDKYELLRLNKSCRISKCGVDEPDDQELVVCVSESEHTTQAKKIIDYYLTVVLHGKSKFAIWDSDDELIESFKCKKDGEKHELLIISDQYRMSITYPNDVELYLDDKPYGLAQYANETRVEMDLDLR